MIERGPAIELLRGSELPRLLFLAAVMMVGWVVVWNYAQKLNHAAEPELAAGDARAGGGGSERRVRDGYGPNAAGIRDNAAYSLLLERRAAPPTNWLPRHGEMFC